MGSNTEKCRPGKRRNKKGGYSQVGQGLPFRFLGLTANREIAASQDDLRSSLNCIAKSVNPDKKYSPSCACADDSEGVRQDDIEQ